jgi:hypothetical protein
MSGKPPKHPPSVPGKTREGVVNSPEALEEARKKREAEEKAKLNEERFKAFFGKKGGKTRKYRKTGKHTTKKVKRRNNGRRTRS